MGIGRPLRWGTGPVDHCASSFTSAHRNAQRPTRRESQRVFAPGIFTDQVAIVTGGGSGIGLATALGAGPARRRVAICGRTAESSTPRASSAQRRRADACCAATCDIREPAQVEAFVKDVIGAFGRVDILVNNAGGQFPSPAQHISPNGFLAVVKNNLVGTFHMCREVANQWMIPQKGGRIVNVIANIYRGFPGHGAHGRGARGRREHDDDARGRVGAVRDPRQRGRARASSSRRAPRSIRRSCSSAASPRRRSSARAPSRRSPRRSCSSRRRRRSTSPARRCASTARSRCGATPGRSREPRARGQGVPRRGREPRHRPRDRARARARRRARLRRRARRDGSRGARRASSPAQGHAAIVADVTTRRRRERRGRRLRRARSAASTSSIAIVGKSFAREQSEV